MKKTSIKVSLFAIQTGNYELLMCEARDSLEKQNINPIKIENTPQNTCKTRKLV